MEKNEYQEFLDAVDVVCGACTERSEEVCENCPVRKTCDKVAEE